MSSKRTYSTLAEAAAASAVTPQAMQNTINQLQLQLADCLPKLTRYADLLRYYQQQVQQLTSTNATQQLANDALTATNNKLTQELESYKPLMYADENTPQVYARMISAWQRRSKEQQATIAELRRHLAATTSPVLPPQTSTSAPPATSLPSTSTMLPSQQAPLTAAPPLGSPYSQFFTLPSPQARMAQPAIAMPSTTPQIGATLTPHRPATTHELPSADADEWADDSEMPDCQSIDDGTATLASIDTLSTNITTDSQCTDISFDKPLTQCFFGCGRSYRNVAQHERYCSHNPAVAAVPPPPLTPSTLDHNDCALKVDMTSGEPDLNLRTDKHIAAKADVIALFNCPTGEGAVDMTGSYTFTKYKTILQLMLKQNKDPRIKNLNLWCVDASKLPHKRKKRKPTDKPSCKTENTHNADTPHPVIEADVISNFIDLVAEFIGPNTVLITVGSHANNVANDPKFRKYLNLRHPILNVTHASNYLSDQDMADL